MNLQVDRRCRWHIVHTVTEIVLEILFCFRVQIKYQLTGIPDALLEFPICIFLI